MIRDLLDSLDKLSPAAYMMAFMLGLQSGIGIYQLTRIPVLWSCLSISSASRRDGAISTCVFCLSMIMATILIGVLSVRIPSFTIQVSIWTRAIYFLLGVICVLSGLSVAGLIVYNEERLHGFFRSRGRLVLPVAFLLGFLFSLLETPICPSCGSNISLISQATLGAGKASAGLALLALYALGQCMPLFVTGAFWVLLWRRAIRPDQLSGEVTWLISGFLLLLSAFLFFWTS